MDGLYTGWLAADGTFFPCKVYDHLETAKELCEQFNLPYQYAEDALLECGWVQISISYLFEYGYHIMWYNHLTDYQKNFLRPYFEGERGLNVTESTQRNWDLEELD